MRHVRFRDAAGYIRQGKWADGDTISSDRSYEPDEVDILPPCEPTKIVCVGLNYADHAAEAGMDVPERPMLFLKGPNALAGHGDTITLPANKERVDYEAELGVVIGEQCRNIPKERAMDTVAGFTCMNDVSNRDDQEIEQNWIRGKAFDNSAPVGPVIATPDEVPDDASVRLDVNGERRQESRRSEFIFSIPELIEEITTYMTLERGDIISTGTPAGIGPLSDGDRVSVQIEGVGTLEHEVTVP